MAGGGESLQTLVVGPGMHEAERDGAELIDDFRHHCPNFSSLRIAEPGTSSVGMTGVDKFTKQLEKLEIIMNRSLNVPFDSTVLRELTFQTYADDNSCADLWKKLGCSLEKLVIGLPFHRKHQVDEIGRNLKSVSISGQHAEVVATVTTLLTSYGDKLEYAYLQGTWLMLVQTHAFGWMLFVLMFPPSD